MRYNADKIVQLRSRLGMTLVEFAQLLGVSAGTVSRWERGLNRPARTAVEKINRIAEGQVHEKN